VHFGGFQSASCADSFCLQQVTFFGLLCRHGQEKTTRKPAMSYNNFRMYINTHDNRSCCCAVTRNWNMQLSCIIVWPNKTY